MTGRIWDPEDKFFAGELKEYRHWFLEVNYQQPTLGCYLILARRDVEMLADLRPAELVDLGDVTKDIRHALAASSKFRPDWVNHLQLGNGMRHLHFHGIPRYEKPRAFAGRTWVDSGYGGLVVPAKRDESHDLVLTIRDALIQYLP